MKRLFFLLIVAVACVLPQSVWADAVLNGTTLTITTTAPGQVAGFVSPLESKASVTKIIFKGEFSGSDLSAVSYSAGFTNVATVDMSEAQFKAAQSSTYKKLSSPSDGGNNGDKGVVGGTLYKTTGTTVHTWTPTNATTAESSNNMETPSWSERERNSHLSDYSNKYVKVMLAQYYQKQQRFTSQTVTTTEDAATYTKNDDITQEQINKRTANVSGWNNGAKFKIVTGYKYYQYKNSGWVEESQTEGHNYSEQTNTDDQFKSTISNPQEDSYYSFPVFAYYIFNWYYQAIETSDIPSGTTFDSGNYPSWAATEEGRANNANDSHEYVGTAVSYNYYHVTTSTSYTWGTSSDSPYEVHYVVSSAADLPTATADKYAIVGGMVYAHDGTGWETSSAAENQVNDYSQMKFTYWKETLTTAITSNTANTSIANDIFSGCTKLTSVDYRSGNLTGFSDHKGPSDTGYANFSVTVGKDVTSIDANAFKDCDALTTITFDKNYTDLQSDNNYPKVLTIGTNAFLDCVNLTGISIPNRVSLISQAAFKNAGTGVSEFAVTFERRYYGDKTTDEGNYDQGKDFDTPLVIESSAFEDCTTLKKLSLPVRLTSIGTRSFANTSGLKSLTMREDTEHNLLDMTDNNSPYSSLKTIPSQTFSGSGVEEIVVPSSVELIESAAFQQTNYLKKITFQNTNNTPLVIKSGAFAGGREEGTPVLDVYVNVDPDSRKIVCEYDAFTYTQMEGQTSVESHQFAKLHFDKKYWDYYQGNWKRGLAFRQENLNAFKDGYTDTSKGYIGKSSGEISTTEGKYLTGEPTSQYTPANGWQQFAGTNTEIDIQIPRGSFMRTYSTNTAYVIPTFAEKDDSYNIKAGDPMFRIYRISSFSDGFNEGTSNANSHEEALQARRVATATEVIEPDHNGRNYIPSNTGLLMVGQVNADYVVYFADADFTEMTEKKYPYFTTSGENTNLLYPTCINELNLVGDGTSTETNKAGQPSLNADGKIVVNSTIPFPYYNANEVLYRCFGYNVANNQFRRVKGAQFTRDKAYLKLTAAMFHWTDEYTSDTDNNNEVGNGTSSSRIAVEFTDDEESGTTGIKQVDTTMQRVDSNVFYTLEGVKLNSRPTQRGIYIHNGRKVVIK